MSIIFYYTTKIVSPNDLLDFILLILLKISDFAVIKRRTITKYSF